MKDVMYESDRKWLCF